MTATNTTHAFREPDTNCAAAVACRNWDGKNFPPLDDNVHVVSSVNCGQPVLDITYADGSTLTLHVRAGGIVKPFWTDKQ